MTVGTEIFQRRRRRLQGQHFWYSIWFRMTNDHLIHVYQVLAFVHAVSTTRSHLLTLELVSARDHLHVVHDGHCD